MGVYGVLNFDVAERRQELSVRMALGAGPAQLRWLVLGRGLAMTLGGVAAGVAGVALLTTALPIGQLSRAVNWTMTAAGVSVVALASIAALWIPARRAAGADPVAALRD